MPELILGAVALLVILLLLWGFVGVDPKLLARSLRYFGAGLLLLAAIGLAFIDRVAWSIFAASCAWALFTGGRLPGLHWPFPQTGSRARPRGQTGGTTQVRTEWIEMTLDHDSGEMSGRVLKGTYAGKALDALSQNEAIELYLEAGRDDSETGNLLSAYLDRRFGADWHDTARRAQERSRNTQSRPDAGMSRAEAYRVLGLEPGADDDAIRAAHRELMLKNHPDRGGSSDAAALINEAKDVLLGK